MKTLLPALLVGAGLAAAVPSVSAQTYTWTTLAGMPSGWGFADGPGGAARFNKPSSVALAPNGRVYVADTYNNVIRTISPDGVVTTLAGRVGVQGGDDGTGSAASFRQPVGVAVDAGGQVFVADQGNSTIRKISPSGVVTTFAGSASFVGGDTDGTGVEARFFRPAGVAVDTGGNVFVADLGNCTIRKITPAGVVTTLAGMARQWGGADGTGSAARFNEPEALAVDGGGNVYVADTKNSMIRKITPGGVVSTLAGRIYEIGSADGVGAAAQFFWPAGIAVDGNGVVFVADTENSTIRKIAATGLVTTLAGLARTEGCIDGSGGAARFLAPTGMAVDGSGNLVVADTRNGAIRKVSPTGAVTTLAGVGYGSADGTGAAARFYYPASVAVDATGHVYVADSWNHTIRKINPAGVVTTLAGTAGIIGVTDGIGSAALFARPENVAVDDGGNVFVANYYTIRKITPAGVVTTLAGVQGQSGSVDGTGTGARFGGLSCLAVDRSGGLVGFDSGAIRKITTSGVVTTLAGSPGNWGNVDGTGGAARFEGVAAITVDAEGNVFTAGYRSGYVIRKTTPAGVVTTVTGLAGGRGIAADGSGNLFVADYDRHAILKVGADGAVTTPGGALDGSAGSADGAGSAVRFNFPSGVAVDARGNLYVADTYNNTIRKGVPSGPAPAVSRIVNISTRGLVPAGGELTPGFVIRGSGAKALVVRAVGPQLGSFGLTGLVDPRLDLIVAGAPAANVSNDDWGGGASLRAAFAAVGAFPLTTDSKSAAATATVSAAGVQSCTVRVTSSIAGGSGVALAEIYDRDPAGSACRLVNVSTLGVAGTGATALTPGFVIAGSEPKSVLIRAIGPGLAPFGIAEALGDPELAVTPLGQSSPLASNSDWGGTPALAVAFSQAGAFALAPGSKDAALVVRLPPGGYTVQISGAGNTTGTALVEIYDLDP